MNYKMGKIIKQLITFISVIIIWHLVVTYLQISEYLFPSPSSVISSLFNNKQTIFVESLITLTEAMVGFFLANIISLLIALIIVFDRDLENTIMPFAVMLKTIPVIVITPLLVIWFGSGIYSKIATAGLICFFPALVCVLRGVKSLDQDLVGLFKLYSADKLQLIRMLIFPSISPYLLAALKVSSSLAVVGALVGEFIGANRGLGFLIISNYYVLNTPYVFASIIVASSIGIAFYYVIHFIEKKTITWMVSID